MESWEEIEIAGFHRNAGLVRRDQSAEIRDMSLRTQINRIFWDKCLPTCFQMVSSAPLKLLCPKYSRSSPFPFPYTTEIYLQENLKTRTHTHTHTYIPLHRHRRSRCNASITQSAFRELNEPNNCIEHLDAHGAPNLLCLPSAPFHPFIVTKVTILSRTTDLLRISILEDANVFLNRRLY